MGQAGWGRGGPPGTKVSGLRDVSVIGNARTGRGPARVWCGPQAHGHLRVPVSKQRADSPEHLKSLQPSPGGSWEKSSVLYSSLDTFPERFWTLSLASIASRNPIIIASPPASLGTRENVNFFFHHGKLAQILHDVDCCFGERLTLGPCLRGSAHRVGQSAASLRRGEGLFPAPGIIVHFQSPGSVNRRFVLEFVAGRCVFKAYLSVLGSGAVRPLKLGVSSFFVDSCV